jgi:molybdate transport system substrate-binding protein
LRGRLKRIARTGNSGFTETTPEREDFVRLRLAALLLMAWPLAAGAEDITVLSPGIANGPLRVLAAAWQAKTGNQVTITGGNVGRIRAAVQSDAPADLVLVPASGMGDLAAKLVDGSQKPVGRILFGIVVKAGGAHPDISTPQKFIAFARQAGALAYTDPTVGSLSGGMVDKLLKTPQFQGVRGVPVRAMIGDAIVRGDAAYGAGAISEEKLAKGGEVVGRIPDEFGLFIVVSGAVLTAAKAPQAPADFLAYITSKQAAPDWTEGGIAVRSEGSAR